MKRILSLCLLLLLLIPVTSCGNTTPWRSYDFFSMDTILTVTVYGDGNAAICREASEIAISIEKRASATLSDSEVTAFNNAETSYTFSQEMTEILTLALATCEATEGAYDITVSPLVSLWNINKGGPVPSEEEIEAALRKVSYKKLTLEGNTLTKSDPEVMIDLGSVAKGYALGKMAAFLSEKGMIGNVNFGGNVALVGNKPDGAPWRVSLRDPFQANAVAGTLSLTGGVVAVSGDYERYFEEDGVRYHHILSPEDGYPVRGVHSVAVICDDATQADLLSTALFVMGKKGAADFWEKGIYDFSYVLILEGGETVVSPDLSEIYQPIPE